MEINNKWNLYTKNFNTNVYEDKRVELRMLVQPNNDILLGVHRKSDKNAYEVRLYTNLVHDQHFVESMLNVAIHGHVFQWLRGEIDFPFAANQVFYFAPHFSIVNDWLKPQECFYVTEHENQGTELQQFISILLTRSEAFEATINVHGLYCIKIPRSCEYVQQLVKEAQDFQNFTDAEIQAITDFVFKP